jgi:NhaP-type Na+/H+ or K+/H+ antiporter
MLAIMKDMSVDPVLYNLIFGESIFNDAVTIVLYRSIVDNKTTGSNAAVIFQSIGLFFLIFLVSFLVGLVVAMLISLVLKKVSSSAMTNRYNLEATAVILGPWVCYLISEALSMSGIVAALFCGIFMARYTQPNLSDLSKAVVGRAYSVVAHAGETLVFIFLGIGLFSFDLPFKRTGVILGIGSIVFCLVGRAISVLMNSALLNQFRSHKISFKMQFVLWFGGLRGAIGSL